MLLSRTFYRLFIAFIASLMLVAILAPIGQAQTLSSEYFLETLRKKGKGKGKNRGKRRGPKKRQYGNVPLSDAPASHYSKPVHCGIKIRLPRFCLEITDLCFVRVDGNKSRFLT